jgi:superfamily I DNA and RNA helicase
LKTKHSKLIDNVSVCAINEDELSSDLDSNKEAPDPKEKKTPQELETSQTIDRPQQTDPLQILRASNSISDSDLLRSLNEMKTEEQELKEQKQRLVEAQQNLQNKLVKEIEKRKKTIAHLKSEIANLETVQSNSGKHSALTFTRKLNLR